MKNDLKFMNNRAVLYRRKIRSLFIPYVLIDIRVRVRIPLFCCTEFAMNAMHLLTHVSYNTNSQFALSQRDFTLRTITFLTLIMLECKIKAKRLHIVRRSYSLTANSRRNIT